MANRDGHRRFGNIRPLPSGRFQIRYRGPDGRMRSGTDTYADRRSADRALALIESQMITGEWTDPQRAKITLGAYVGKWIDQRPNLRPRTLELYRWLLAKHIDPHLGRVPVGKITRSWSGSGVRLC